MKKKNRILTIIFLIVILLVLIILCVVLNKKSKIKAQQESIQKQKVMQYEYMKNQLNY